MVTSHFIQRLGVRNWALIFDFETPCGTPSFSTVVSFLILKTIKCVLDLQLQDRTQFSDRDLATLKRYWDRGMTSLGAICREKIEAVAAELNVDCEIVRVRTSSPPVSGCRK